MLPRKSRKPIALRTRDDRPGAENPIAADVMSELECRRKFLKHRAAFPAEKLARYAGRWIAWSPDGSRIVADSEAPENLDDQILAAGEDLTRCVVEGIPETDAMLGVAGLGPTGS
jgi:hypothetical protein